MDEINNLPSWHERVAKLRAENEKLVNNLQDEDYKVAKLRSENDRLVEENSKLKKDYVTMANMFYTSHNDAHDLAKEFASLVDENNKLREALKQEREECAKLCDQLDAHPATMWPSDCAAAIRAKNDKE